MRRIERYGPGIVVVPATALMGAVGTLFLDTIVTVLIGSIVGAMWGLLLTLIANRLRRARDRRLTYGSVAVFGAVFGSGILAGGGLLDQMLTDAGLASVATTLTLYQPPFGSTINLFIITLNSLMEYVLLPAVLLLNWEFRRRRALILMAFVAYYAMRVWTYAYFVPNIFDFAELPAGGPYPAEAIERFRTWVALSWFRAPVDIGVFLLLIGTALQSIREHPGPPSTFVLPRARSVDPGGPRSLPGS